MRLPCLIATILIASSSAFAQSEPEQISFDVDVKPLEQKPSVSPQENEQDATLVFQPDIQPQSSHLNTEGACVVKFDIDTIGKTQTVLLKTFNQKQHE